MTALSASDVLTLWDRSHGLRPGARALALLAGCTGRPMAECADVSVGQRDRILLSAYGSLFGRAIECQAECPACREALELPLDLAVFNDWHPAREVESLAFCGGRIIWRMPTAGDLAALPRDDASAREVLLARCIQWVNDAGQSVPRAEWPDGVVSHVAAAVAEADPMTDVQVALRCPQCAHDWAVAFDIATFFWSELDLLARRLLGEVHRLASAYGWSEAEILNLSAVRRAVYLERCR